MFPAIYKMDAYKFRCVGVFTTQDANRRLPRRRPARGHLRRRADDGRTSRGAGHGPAGGAGCGTGSSTRSSVHHHRRPDLRLGQLRGGHGRAKELFDYDGLRAEQERRRASNDPVQLGIGISTFTEMCGIAPSRVLGSLSFGAGGWEHASIRMLPTGKVEVVTGFQRGTARATRRRGARSSPTASRRAVRGHPGAARRHPDLAQGHGTPTDLGPWRSAGWPCSRPAARWSRRPR